MSITDVPEVPRCCPLRGRNPLCGNALKHLLTKSHQSAISTLRLYSQGILFLEEP